MLNPRYLVVKQLHRVDQTAAVLIVLSIGAEDAKQQYSRFRAEWMYGVVGNRCSHEVFSQRIGLALIVIGGLRAMSVRVVDYGPNLSRRLLWIGINILLFIFKVHRPDCEHRPGRI